MNDPKDPQAELREAIQMWVELAVHKFHAADGVVVMGDCSRESVDEITKLSQAHQQQLISELLGELPSRKRTDNDHEPTRQYLEGFNAALTQVVSAIEKLKQTNDGGKK